MNRAANPHWIGPKRGTYVTVRLRGMEFTNSNYAFTNGTSSPDELFRAVIIGPYRAELRDDGPRLIIPLDPNGLDTTWCYDWTGDNVDALKALLKLQETT